MIKVPICDKIFLSGRKDVQVEADPARSLMNWHLPDPDP
jgi:hypothetical protein